jgi:hypothetical protein
MTTHTPKKFADLRRRNEPMNLGIGDLLTLKSLLAHLCHLQMLYKLGKSDMEMSKKKAVR